MPRQRLVCAQDSLIEGFSRAHAAGKIRKHDAEVAPRLLVDHRWIIGLLRYHARLSFQAWTAVTRASRRIASRCFLRCCAAGLSWGAGLSLFPTSPGA